MATAHDIRTTLELLTNNLRGVTEWANKIRSPAGGEPSRAVHSLQDLATKAEMLRKAILTDLTTANDDPSTLDSIAERVRYNVSCLLCPIGSYVPPGTISSRHFIVDEAIAPDTVDRDYLGIAIDRVLDRLWDLTCTGP